MIDLIIYSQKISLVLQLINRHINPIKGNFFVLANKDGFLFFKYL